MSVPSDIKKAVACCVSGDGKTLRRLLAQDPELARRPALLNDAALFGQLEAVRILLEAGADPDAAVPSHEYYRPLHRAIEHRGRPRKPEHIPVIKALLDAGATLEARSTWMQLVPLAVAGMVGNEEMITLLVKRGAPVNLFTAAVTADVGKVRSFLKRKGAATGRDDNNMTPLHYVALSGLGDRFASPHREIANLLLDAGGNGDAREPIGPYPATPVLHFAAWKNYAVAETLLSRGCNPNFGFGNCLWKEPGPMAELFLSHGADVNTREASGQPLLHSRIHWNLPSVALWLLKNGADPNLADKEGHTALHEAARRGINPKVTQALLDAGGRKFAKNRAGLTPLDIAKQKKRLKLIPLLS
jgi:ankyrin repeat protein